MNKDPFREYIKESEPTKRDKGYAWHTAIGLQAVDGLKTSEYLVRTAIRNIEGEISLEEANELLRTYYEENPTCDASDRTEEADKVSARIAGFFPSALSVSLRTSTSPFTESCSLAFIPMLGASETITSRRRNGC